MPRINARNVFIRTVATRDRKIVIRGNGAVGGRQYKRAHGSDASAREGKYRVGQTVVDAGPMVEIHAGEYLLGDHFLRMCTIMAIGQRLFQEAVVMYRIGALIIVQSVKLFLDIACLVAEADGVRNGRCVAAEKGYGQ